MAQKEKLKKFLPVVKIAVSVLFLTYIIKKMDLDNPEKLNNFKNILLGINPGHLIAGFIVMVVIVFLGAYRWRLFLLPQGIDINLGKAFEYTLIGFFFNNFFPSTVGGDIAKGVIVGRSSKKGIGTAVSIIMDRLIGMLAMGAMAIFALLISFNLPLDTRIRIMVIVFVFMVLVFQYLIFHKNFARKVAGILNKCRLRIIAEKIISVSDAFYTYRTKSKVMKKTFTISFIMWTGNILASFILARGLGIELSFMYFIIIIPLIMAIMSIPVSFGGLGLRELAYVSLFGMAGVAGERALAISLSYYAVTLLLSLAGGLVLLKTGFIDPIIRGKKKGAEK